GPGAGPGPRGRVVAGVPDAGGPVAAGRSEAGARGAPPAAGGSVAAGAPDAGGPVAAGRSEAGAAGPPTRIETMGPSMRIERMRTADIPELLPIERDLFGPERWTEGMFRSELDQGYYYLVARDEDGTVLGYGGLAVLPPDEAWVNNLAVRRDAQRRGIGRRLLAELFA